MKTVFSVVILLVSSGMMLWHGWHMNATAVAAWAGFMGAHLANDRLDRQEKK